MGHHRHAGLGEQVAHALQRDGPASAETEGMACGYPPLHSRGLGSVGQCGKLAQARWSGIMQVHVQPHPAAFRNAEQDIELAGQIAVETDRINAADQIGAVADCGVQQFRHPGSPHHTALREGNDLHVHQMPGSFPHP